MQGHHCYNPQGSFDAGSFWKNSHGSFGRTPNGILVNLSRYRVLEEFETDQRLCSVQDVIVVAVSDRAWRGDLRHGWWRGNALTSALEIELARKAEEILVRTITTKMEGERQQKQEITAAELLRAAMEPLHEAAMGGKFAAHNCASMKNRIDAFLQRQSLKVSTDNDADYKV